VKIITTPPPEPAFEMSIQMTRREALQILEMLKNAKVATAPLQLAAAMNDMLRNEDL